MAATIKKGDEVEVMRGDEAGNKGKVVRVIRATNQLVIAGLNLRKRHMKPTAKVKQGGIIDKEGPIHRSNVRLIEAAGKTAKGSAEKRA